MHYKKLFYICKVIKTKQLKLNTMTKRDNLIIERIKGMIKQAKETTLENTKLDDIEKARLEGYINALYIINYDIKNDSRLQPNYKGIS